MRTGNQYVYIPLRITICSQLQQDTHDTHDRKLRTYFNEEEHRSARYKAFPYTYRPSHMESRAERATDAVAIHASLLQLRFLAYAC